MHMLICVCARVGICICMRIGVCVCVCVRYTFSSFALSATF